MAKKIFLFIVLILGGSIGNDLGVNLWVLADRE